MGLSKIKQALCFALPLTPFLFGYIWNYILARLNFTIQNTTMVSLFMNILSPMIFIFWLWVGWQFSKIKMPAISAILIGNSIGILSLFVLIWQTFFIGSEQMNMSLYIFFSNYFSLATLITAKIIGLFIYLILLFNIVPPTDSINIIRIVYIIALIFMVAVFVLGYFSGKRKKKEV